MSDERPNADVDLPADLAAAGPGASGASRSGGGDDLLVEPWEEVAPEVEYAHARSRMQLRGLVFVVVTFVAVWSIFGWPFGASTVGELAYFLAGGDEPVDLGDLRELRAGGRTTLDVPSNTYVRLSGQVMTYEAESDTYQYFFCPLFNIITRTPRPLPEKEVYRSVEVPADLLWLVENRHAFAEDLTASFGGEGRLLRADEAPRLRYLYEAYARTVTDPVQPEETWFFLDGDTPESYWPYAAGYAVAIVLVLMTGWFFLRAVRVHRRLQAEL